MLLLATACPMMLVAFSSSETARCVVATHSFFYTGNYECSAVGHWQGKMTSQEHTPTGRPMAARVQHIGFLGTYNDAGAKVDAIALVGEQSVRYDATLRLLLAV